MRNKFFKYTRPTWTHKYMLAKMSVYACIVNNAVYASTKYALT